MVAIAHMTAGDHAAAETVLTESRAENNYGSVDADTLVNLVACSAQQGKDTSALVAEFRTARPNHPWLQALDRVEGAFERESKKYVGGVVS